MAKNSSSRYRRQDLNRRKIAAISFLANIRVNDEKDEDLPGFRCLTDTHVIEKYLKNKGRRKLGSSGKKEAMKSVIKNTDASQTASRDRTPEAADLSRKLSDCSKKFANLKNPEIGGRGRRQLIYSSQWSDDNTLEPESRLQHTLVKRVNSSQESIIFNHPDQRMRQISGNLSENSVNSSLKVSRVLIKMLILNKTVKE